jgi:hypothetical protein
MGEIRDASLHKEILYICKGCYYPEVKPKTNKYNEGDAAVQHLMGIFGMSNKR